MASNTVLDKIRALDQQKAKLMEEAKGAALATAQAAIDELNELGFNYRLVEGGAAPRSTRTASTGTRRSGIRDDVYNAVKAAGADGTTPAAIRQVLGIAQDDASGKQSVSNALSALKKANKIAEKNGNYVTA